MARAYLDHAATTPLRREAAEAMAPWLGERYGNPSGSHAESRAARRAVDDARDTLAEALGVEPGEIVFTGGGTEADNLALIGRTQRAPGDVVISAVEHHAVLHAAPVAARLAGGSCRVVPVDGDGRLCLDALGEALGPRVSAVSVMLANNEVGTLQDLDAVASLVRRLAPEAVLHTDAVQAFAWVDVSALAAGADMVAVSAHKFGGPQGVGALASRGVDLAPILHGGGQERDRRSGTHNVAGIVGMAAAAEATVGDRAATAARVAPLRDRLADGLLTSVPDAVETGCRASKLPGTCSLRFPGVESEALLILLDRAGVAASAGSACTSGAMEPSHVLTAMGVRADEALSSLRLSLGRTTTPDDVDLALSVIPGAVARLRSG